MRRRKKIIIAILLVILIGLVAAIVQALYFPSADNGMLSHGDKNILVCALDESEPRDGMGACDMAFIVHLSNGSMTGYEPVYPHGLRHPTQAEPAAYVAQGAGKRLLLHDAYYSANNTQGMIWAKEIVEYNKNTTIDAVVCIDTKGVSNILKVINPVVIDNKTVNVSGADFVREEQYGGGASRGDAVLVVVKAVAQKAQEPQYKTDLINAAITEYNNGNIIMYPEGAFMSLLATKGIETIFG
ncbi:MAG: DUF4012 domain-containing protein [archaeon]|nr:DUF4012 domain-containing protein [archaeon]